MDLGSDSYVVFDRADLGSLYIRPGLGTSWSNGTRTVATDASSDIAIDMKQVSQKYLSKKGKKDCALDNGKEIMNGQYEFKYKCKG